MRCAEKALSVLSTKCFEMTSMQEKREANNAMKKLSLMYRNVFMLQVPFIVNPRHITRGTSPLCYTMVPGKDVVKRDISENLISRH